MSDYTHDDMLTCAIIWEDLLGTRGYDSDFGRWLEGQCEAVGTCEMRDHAVTLAQPMNKAWSDTEWLHGSDEPFDWEFVPKVLAYMFELQGSLDPSAVPVAALLASMDIEHKGQDWQRFVRFDSRLVTLFKGTDGETYWDDADVINPNAIRTALGIYGRDDDGLATHLIDIPLSEDMGTRGVALLAALNLYVES